MWGFILICIHFITISIICHITNAIGNISLRENSVRDTIIQIQFKYSSYICICFIFQDLVKNCKKLRYIFNLKCKFDIILLYSS